MNGPLQAPLHGAFGVFGGRFVSELLQPALKELAHAVDTVLVSPAFKAALAAELANWGGRPTPLLSVPHLSERTGLRVFLKREDLLHGGAHKTNNVVGQGLLAREMGKRRLIAETGAGQHGVATAMVGARLGLETGIYMGAVDMDRQRSNVRTMELCGARVIPVTGGAATLKEAINEALRDWTASCADTHYLLGTVCGPDPYPRLVRELQSVIGREAREQFAGGPGGLPDAVVACVGGGSNAIGIWSAFLEDPVQLIGVEAGGPAGGAQHAATLTRGSAGLLHGARTQVLQDADGQILEAGCLAAGLDYPGVGPEHAALHASGRAHYRVVGDERALEAFEILARLEGIVPAFESAHALGFLLDAVERGELEAGARVLVNLSGRGQKDLETWCAIRGEQES